jgi:hypothetical protein
MMTGDALTTDNLNFLVVQGGREILHSFLIQTLHYHRIHCGKSANYAFDHADRCFAIFRRGLKYIMVTEGTSDGLWKLVLSAHTTADMVFMTVGSLAMFYPSWTNAGVMIANLTLALPAMGQRMGCMKYLQWQLRLDTAFLNGPCRRSCPMLWCKVAN